VFYYLTYEDAVDVSAIEDPVQKVFYRTIRRWNIEPNFDHTRSRFSRSSTCLLSRSQMATIAQIDNFGQTPHQVCLADFAHLEVIESRLSCL